MNKILCENLQKITRNTNVKFCLYGLALYKVYIYIHYRSKVLDQLDFFYVFK